MSLSFLLHIHFDKNIFFIRLLGGCIFLTQIKELIEIFRETMVSLIESHEKQYAVLTAEITSEIGRLKRTPAGIIR